MTISSKLKFSYLKRTLDFRFDAGTSRGVLKTRDVYWIKCWSEFNLSVIGWGEAAPLVGLSPDFLEDFEQKLQEQLVAAENQSWPTTEDELLLLIKELVPMDLPSIRFGLETAVLDLLNGGQKRILPNDFFDQQRSIPIN